MDSSQTGLRKKCQTMMTSSEIQYDPLLNVFLFYVLNVGLLRKDVLEVKLFKHLEAIGFQSKIHLEVKPKQQTTLS